ncbi:redoxin domain-containing protein [Algibacter sp. 2305UL17-15]|uniref:TlpA family protein disulfide reductase n=1 Tax=Algibacter sp. 2305UL17-15 TaxID=3231268 RepID=UPI00345A11B5
MRKTIKISVLILVLGLTSYLVYGVITKMKYKSDVENTLQTIPNFNFKTLENENFSNADLPSDTPTVFIYFNTECDYCQHEAQSINASLDEFKDVQLLFVSTEEAKIIETFAKKYNLLNTQNIIFLNDTTHSFSRRFDATSIPYVLIYNSKQELIKKHKGQLKAETIINLIKKSN